MPESAGLQNPARRRLFPGAPKRPGPGISITDRCLNKRHTYCDSCRDHCEAKAIRVKPLIGGRLDIQIDLALCTLCGDCASACPTRAIVCIPEQETFT